jgi:CheY-like chemotaxis protein
MWGPVADQRPVVLLVEDSEEDVLLTQEAFDAQDFDAQLQVVEDGEKALRWLRSGRDHPDLVLLDLNLPRKDGREVLKEIKADPNLADIPVVVLTTSAEQEDIREAYCSHVNSYVRKPVSFDKLVEDVRHLGSYWFGLVTLPTAAD